MKRRLDELHPYSYTEYERQLIEAGRTSERPLAIVQAALNSVRLPPNVRRPDGTSAVREVPTVARNPVRWVGAYDRLAIGVALGGVAAAAVVFYAVQSRDVEKVPAPKPLVTEQERDRRVEQDRPLDTRAISSAVSVPLGTWPTASARAPARAQTVVDSGGVDATQGRPDVPGTWVRDRREEASEPAASSTPPAQAHGSPSRSAELTPPDANTLPASSSDRVKESGSRGHESSSAVVAAASGGSGAINEVGLVQLARVALRLGTPLRSLEYSSRARDAYPNGMLGEERDTLMIEALVLVGRRAEALEIERAFEAQYPNSIHLGRVRALVNSAQRFR